MAWAPQSKELEPESQVDYHLQKPASRYLLLPVRAHVPKVPQSPQTIPLDGHHVFKHTNPVKDISVGKIYQPPNSWHRNRGGLK